MGIYLENARCHISGDLLESLVKKKDLPIERKSSDVFSVFYSLIDLKDNPYIEKVIHFNNYYFRKKCLIEWIHLCIKNNEYPTVKDTDIKIPKGILKFLEIKLDPAIRKLGKTKTFS